MNSPQYGSSSIEEFGRFLEGDLHGSSESEDDTEKQKAEASSKEACTHPGSFQDMCYVCGLPVNEKDFGYEDKGLMLKNEELERVKKLGIKKLLHRKKLHLLVDLDHTLLHSADSGEDCLQSQTDGPQDECKALRPSVRSFLRDASYMYEMYMYTDGERSDALEKANLLDPSKEHFGDRVISRDDGAQKHQEGLDIVLGHDNAAVILANTENGWTNHWQNLILVERYGPDETKSEGALATVLEALKEIHRMFFHEPEGDVKMVIKTLKAEVLKGQHQIVFKEFFTSEVPQAWKVTENLGSCYGVRRRSVRFVLDLFSLLTRSSADEDIRSVISWGGDNASFIIHNFPNLHKLVQKLHGRNRTQWLKDLNDYGFYREQKRTFRHRQGLLQRERPDLIPEIRYCGQPGKKRVTA
ncbi:RNA polymerase II C-terminal domain phosphatase-like 4 [Pyrus x bretschneideri]|uniref:RNA polymerase II C-terminal domain phosphatase-like 4 n=1 Tax=Pyrus x bretschneideri TaxID=225117 RepID=UPI00202DE744|nr:RNA polymerase II C-terminal domain phosphatase-like 4 [Pyrus x bretschneideri]